MGINLLWIAILFAAFGSLVENLIQLVNIIGSVYPQIYGIILGVFLVAFFLRHVKRKPSFGQKAIISEALIIFIFTVSGLGELFMAQSDWGGYFDHSYCFTLATVQ